MPAPKLFSPITVGELKLQHRVVLAPLTRFKANEEHIPFPRVAEYYAQRASCPGTLLVTEGTFIAAKAGGWNHVPGIWSQPQIEAWKAVTEAVHAKGSFIYMQLWTLGRAAHIAHLKSEDPSFDVASASDVELTGYGKPRLLTISEIEEYIELYAQAAKNAIEAGFDGVEIHSANGYLLDQFLQDMSNKRTDEYGGSPANRARFPLAVVSAVCNAIGAQRTAIRFSPWSPFQGMRMQDPMPTFTHVLSELKAAHPDLAYVHLVEPRVSGADDVTGDDTPRVSNELLETIWSPGRLISAGGYSTDRKAALETAERTGGLIAYGRMFISNPDLPLRLEKDLPLRPYNRATFYLIGEDSPRGYTDQGVEEEVNSELAHL
ncbi:FMN-linked oxidoreductase [Mycena polygramma]|nr:FMN-linked oxidoreductase [Mycena polygramma]